MHDRRRRDRPRAIQVARRSAPPGSRGQKGVSRARASIWPMAEHHCFSAAPPPDQRPMDHPCRVMWRAPSGSDIAPGSQPVSRQFKRGPDGWRLVGLSMILMVGRRQRSPLVGLLGRGYLNNMTTEVSNSKPGLMLCWSLTS